MKCNNCHGKWEAPKNITLTHCPFCNAVVIRTYSNESVEGKIIEIVQKHSPEIYNNIAKLTTIINEELPSEGTVDLIKAIIPNGATKEIYKLLNCSDQDFENCYVKTINTISSKTFIPKEVLTPAINILCIGLGLSFENVEQQEFDDFEIKNGELIKYTGKDANVVIPSCVKRIGHNAFEECTTVTGVAIPESVEYIGHGVFAHCTSLTRIIIPNTINSIGDNTFAHCTNLRIITLPNSINSIGYRAFYYCTSLTEIVIPKNVTYIGLGAFYQCYNLNETTKGNIRTINSDAIDVGKYLIR